MRGERLGEAAVMGREGLVPSAHECEGLASTLHGHGEAEAVRLYGYLHSTHWRERVPQVVMSEVVFA